MAKKTGVLLVNLGSPEAPTLAAVHRYLTQFLLDPRIMDLPRLQREFLVRGIIIPLRLIKSTRSYRAIWAEEGAPLVATTKKAGHLLQKRLGPEYQVEVGMRYQKPSIEEALRSLKSVSTLICLPLFPQYASATVGSIFEEVTRSLSSFQTIPHLRFISSFYDHPGYIEAVSKRGWQFPLDEYDKILFSYHGLPERHLKRAASTCLEPGCCQKNLHCYSAQCHTTSALIAEKLAIPREQWITTFQSRLGRERWVSPYTQETATRLAREKAKKILIFSPSFTADCLETLYEIGDELKREFFAHGGVKLDLVPSLNTEPDWIEFLYSTVINQRESVPGSIPEQNSP